MIDSICEVQYSDARLLHVSALETEFDGHRHTAILMIQPSVGSKFVRVMMQKSRPHAPSNANTRRTSWVILVHFTFFFVLGLGGFQPRFPYGLLSISGSW